MVPQHYLIVVVITTLLSAWITGVENALLSWWNLRLEIDIHPDSFLSGIKKDIKSNPGKYIAAIKTGNFLNLIILTIALAGLLIPAFENSIQSKSIVLLLTVMAAVVIILLFSRIIPNIVIPFARGLLLNVFIISLLILSVLLYPVTILVIKISNKYFGIQTKDELKTEVINPLFNRIGKNWFIAEKSINGIGKKENVETEAKLFKNALDFSKVKLREIMVPRTEIEMLDINSTMDELRQKFVETGYSRIIFYDQNADNIIGYVHSSAIFKNPASFKPFMKNVLLVPETMPANKLLSTFIREHRSIAIVVDEFGGTAGMVTSEDILEEIFGEIEDEHDTSDIIEKKISDTEFIFSGRSEIDLINEKYQINLPESEDFETLAGFILFHHESIPKINSVCFHDEIK